MEKKQFPMLRYVRCFFKLGVEKLSFYITLKVLLALSFSTFCVSQSSSGGSSSVSPGGVFANGGSAPNFGLRDLFLMLNSEFCRSYVYSWVRKRIRYLG